ncbi:unnamed protein product [Clonostachys rosea]|uniref:FAD/NAD(P)-binding domain-containing protein n=1 Tax=Bionectria ochroleuca TaxID=29856 RepID=A0ABY6U365_BIOOC|nr:unnamed protein product [Clonostachys rosea]
MAETTPLLHRTVAVVGLGAMGIVTVKNLLEEGFDVTGFERQNYIGGVWHFTEDKDTLSALEDTEINVTTDRGCFTDFPFPKGTPSFCSAKVMQDYLEDYVNHNSLRPRFQLNARIKQAAREEDSNKWRLDFETGPSRYFDRLVISTGPHAKPLMPELEGSELFQGEIVHAQAFKRAEDFKDRRVLLVGLGNTVGDIAQSLSGTASEIYLSHERGALILPRFVNGKPNSRLLSLRKINGQAFIEGIFPNWLDSMVTNGAAEVMKESFGKLDPSWNLEPIPSPKVTVPVVSDNLIKNLRSGAVKSVSGFGAFTGPTEVELKDGEKIQVDTVICCTGYQNDLSILEAEYDPCTVKIPSWLEAPGSRGRPLPQLYQNVFSLKTPDTLAFMGCAWFPTGAFLLADLASMSIAQVWAGKSKLPSPAERQKWVDNQNKRVSKLALRGSPVPASVPQMEWTRWADKTAGTGVLDRLGWGWKGWVFWWKERKFWRILMDGLLTSACWRIFDEGKRKPWAGARAEVMRLNEEAAGQDTL